MAYDITNTILDAVIERLPDYLNEGLLSDDDDWLKTIERGPLQDDPTTRATFLLVYPDQDRGFREPVTAVRRDEFLISANLPRYEVGGGYKFVNYFCLEGWTPLQGDKESDYQIAGKLLRRMETALSRMARDNGFLGLHTDDEQETTMGLEQSFTIGQSRFEYIGGENEWYAKVKVKFQVYSEVHNQHWRP